MIPLRRTLTGLALVAAVALCASGCDSSPVAASVNGQDIKQVGLDADLAGRSANKAYIAEVDANAASSGLKVEGAQSGTYSTAWAAQVLTEQIQEAALHQHLASTGRLPGTAVTAAAAAVEAAVYHQGLVWYHFPASIRAAFVQRFADQSMYFPTSGVPASYVKQVFSGYGSSLFTSVCIQTVGVSVTGTGGVDRAASQARAQTVASAIDAGRGSADGTTLCYDQTSFATLPIAEISTVLGLAAHRAAVEPTSYGAQVVAVASRTLVPTGPVLDRVLNAANSTSSGAAAIQAVVGAARVHVDPAYGTWTHSGSAGWRVQAPSTAGLSRAS